MKNLKTLILSLVVVGCIFSNIFSFPFKFPNVVSTYEIIEPHDMVR